MESIGKKIKRIRTEKGLSQSNLNSDNQSAISQIESETNPNPNPETLRVIAKNLDIIFEELIKDTTWNDSRKLSTAGKYVYSQLDFTLYLNDQGQIKVVFNSYPFSDINGIDNKFCPVSGVELISNCSNCKKPILNAEQVFCMGCGEIIFFEYSLNHEYINIQ